MKKLMLLVTPTVLPYLALGACLHFLFSACVLHMAKHVLTNHHRNIQGENLTITTKQVGTTVTIKNLWSELVEFLNSSISYYF